MSAENNDESEKYIHCKLEDIPPEYIQSVHEERERCKERKRLNQLKKGIDPEYPPELYFIKRPILQIQHHDVFKNDGMPISIMTYNCLAQAMIRRDIFPESKSALKWFRRSRVLINEITYYNPDILCLQEIDDVQIDSFWKIELAKLNLQFKYYEYKSKHHGVLIAWKSNIFHLSDFKNLDFDYIKTENIERRTKTRNVALYVSLEFNDNIIKERNNINCMKTGVIICTCHLFWHPFGTFERTRQAYILLNELKKFKDLQITHDDNIHWYSFICGDFNSTPKDTPYLSMTSKPIEYAGRAKKVIECSTSYTFSKKRNGEVEENDKELNNEHLKIHDEGFDLINQPKDMVPDSFTPTQEQAQLVNRLQEMHNKLPMIATSLYSLGYFIRHPSNVNINNDRNEPEFTSWAKSWHGVLDYIMFANEWSPLSNTKQHRKTLQEFEEDNDIEILGYLKLPKESEMKYHSQPFEGEYPSDHICLLCQVKIPYNYISHDV